jgi:hypothetical protein
MLEERAGERERAVMGASPRIKIMRNVRADTGRESRLNAKAKKSGEVRE